MGCTSSNTADKDDAPYGKSTSSPGPKPSKTTPVANTPPEHATTTTTTTGSQQNAAAAPPPLTSSDKKKKKSADSPEKDSKKSSKPKTHNKQKEWGDKGERRAQQNQRTKTEMEPFITAPEHELKMVIEKNKERSKEVIENLEAGVSHVGTDGMVYLNTKEEATKGGGKKQQSVNKGNKVTHLSDIKMPPPPSVPYTHSPPTDTNDWNAADGMVRTENVNVEMVGTEYNGQNINDQHAATASHSLNDQHLSTFGQIDAVRSTGSVESPQDLGTDNASFADDDVAVRIEYIKKDDVGKDFINGNQQDYMNAAQNHQHYPGSEDEHMQNTMNYHLQNNMQDVQESNRSAGYYATNDQMPGKLVQNEQSPTGNFVQNQQTSDQYGQNDEPPSHVTYSNDEMEHSFGYNPRHVQSGMVTFQGNDSFHKHAYIDEQSMNSPSSQQRTSNEPSVQFTDSVQHTIMSSGLEFIAAIDLGYAYSGYAFMDISKPSQVEVNRNWASHLGYTSHKAPTAILFNSKDVVQAFGYQAYEIYDQLISDDEGNLLLYKLAHSFKQKPQDKLTWKLIATSMQYLKTECENMIRKRYDIDPQKVSLSWSIPFPTDWDSRDTMSTFKDHMHKAGFRKSSISWFPDIECALHYCTTKTNLDLKDGKQCILISTGESAVLTYVYQYSKKKGWSSVHKAKSMGGKDITRLFTKFMGYIFGDNFISELQRVHPSEWCNFINAFDMAKRDIATGMQLSVNYAFENFHREFTGGKTLKDAINQKSKETGPSVSLTKSGTLKFRHGTMIMLFNAVLQDIEGKVNSAVGKFPKADTVFLVGGLADCAWVRERIASGAQDRRLVVPEEPNLCVLKGAVLKGFAKRENAK